MITAKPLQVKHLQAHSGPETATSPTPQHLHNTSTTGPQYLHIQTSINTGRKIKEERKPLFIGGKIFKLLVTVVEQGHGMTAREVNHVMVEFCKKMNCFPIPDMDATTANLKKLVDLERIVRVKIPDRPYLYYRKLE